MTSTTTRWDAFRDEPHDARMAARGWHPGPPLLGLFAGWVALFSWSGMVAEPSDFLMPTLFVGLLMALAGSGLRMLRVAPYAVAAVQVVIALLSLNVIFAAGLSRLGVIPTMASVREVVRVIRSGAATLNTYSAPVEVNPTHTEAMLMVCGLAVLLSIDVIAMGLRKPPLVALPLLVTLSIPVSILNGPIALPVYVGTALLFLRLVATENLERFHAWGRETTEGPQPVHATLWSISIVAVVVSLLVAPLIPVADLLDDTPGGEGPGGGGSAYHLTSVNPFIRLRRDLVEKTHTPMVYAETKARSTSYLRTTVLDRFTDDEWRPSPRSLPSSNRADGTFPSPPGLAPRVTGAEDTWRFEFAPNFSSTWLPLPYPVRKLDIEGSWRFDERTLDVAFVGGGPPQQLKYGVTSFTPSVTAKLLASSGARPPTRIQAPMTSVPDVLPDVIRTRARQVTRGAETKFEKAVALQDWFRTLRWLPLLPEAAQRVGHGPARLLRHQRPGRLLRAVRRGDGRDGTCARHPLARGRRLPGRQHPERRPAPLHQRRPARLAGDVLHRGGLGALRADPGRARRRHAFVDQAVRRHRGADGRPERGCQPGVGARSPTRGRSRRSPTATSSCRAPRGR